MDETEKSDPSGIGESERKTKGQVEAVDASAAEMALSLDQPFLEEVQQALGEAAAAAPQALRDGGDDTGGDEETRVTE